MTQAVLVLNSDFSPINITSLNRGFALVYKGKAEILKSSEEPIQCGVKKYLRPLIIRLLNYVNFQKRRIRVNRHRIMRRDGYSCVYCGSKKHLTLDHVLPKSRGGRNSWNNLVTCCTTCNMKKGNRTPEEAGMKLRHKPYEPSIFSSILSVEIENIWNDFQIAFV